VASGTDFGGGGVPVIFWDGEFFADFYLGVVDGEAEDVDLEAFASCWSLSSFVLLRCCCGSALSFVVDIS